MLGFKAREFKQHKTISLEDLGFTVVVPQITHEEIVDVLEEGGLSRVNKIFVSDFTIKIERLQ